MATSTTAVKISQIPKKFWQNGTCVHIFRQNVIRRNGMTPLDSPISCLTFHQVAVQCVHVAEN